MAKSSSSERGTTGPFLDSSETSSLSSSHSADVGAVSTTSANSDEAEDQRVCLPTNTSSSSSRSSSSSTSARSGTTQSTKSSVDGEGAEDEPVTAVMKGADKHECKSCRSKTPPAHTQKGGCLSNSSSVLRREDISVSELNTTSFSHSPEEKLVDSLLPTGDQEPVTTGEFANASSQPPPPPLSSSSSCSVAAAEAAEAAAASILDAPALCNLIVNYLPPLMDELSLFQLFSQFGPLMSIKIIYDRETGESKGYGFIRYECFFSATFALANLNRYEIGGKSLKLAYADRPAAEKSLEAIKNLPPSQQGFTERQKRVFNELYYQQQQYAARFAQKEV